MRRGGSPGCGHAGIGEFSQNRREVSGTAGSHSISSSISMKSSEGLPFALNRIMSAYLSGEGAAAAAMGGLFKPKVKKGKEERRRGIGIGIGDTKRRWMEPNACVARACVRASDVWFRERCGRLAAMLYVLVVEFDV